MRLYTQISLEGLDIVRTDSGGFANIRATKYFENHTEVSMVVWCHSLRDDECGLVERNCVRHDLHTCDKNGKTALIEYNDFYVGGAADDRPIWYPAVADRIIKTSGKCDYGLGQRLQVTESIKRGCAEARIRSLSGAYHEVHRLLILAKGAASFADALQLHSDILSGKAYEPCY